VKETDRKEVEDVSFRSFHNSKIHIGEERAVSRLSHYLFLPLASSPECRKDGMVKGIKR